MALIEEFQFGQPRSTGENHLRLKLIAVLCAVVSIGVRSAKQRNYLKKMDHNFWNSVDAKNGFAL